jgi:hypothetical protein
VGITKQQIQPTNLESKCGIADSCGPYLAALSYSSKSGMASSFIFLGTARTSGGRAVFQSTVPMSHIQTRGLLRSGICTRKSFLHSLGFVIWAGMNGYCRWRRAGQSVACSLPHSTSGCQKSQASASLVFEKIAREYVHALCTCM